MRMDRCATSAIVAAIATCSEIDFLDARRVEWLAGVLKARSPEGTLDSALPLLPPLARSAPAAASWAKAERWRLGRLARAARDGRKAPESPSALAPSWSALLALPGSATLRRPRSAGELWWSCCCRADCAGMDCRRAPLLPGVPGAAVGLAAAEGVKR